MGKNAKFKQLRKIVATLRHETKIVAGVPEKIRGKELIKKGATKLVDGTPIIPNNLYKRQTKKQVVINHYKIMKRLYVRHGVEVVSNYIRDHAA